jgi:putative tryptophan/tyrosine transport system substrate-binding protein
MMKKTFCITSAFFFASTIAAIGVSPPACCADDPVIAVIRSRIIKPYNDALAGFESALNTSRSHVTLRIFDLEAVEGKGEKGLQEIASVKPVLTFAIGTEAAVFAKEKLKDLPVVFSMVLDPVKAGIVASPTASGDSLRGVTLDISPEVQFAKLKELLPAARRVGILYNPEETEWLNGTKRTAERMNLAIVAKAVNSGADVPARLDELSREVDCVWAQVAPSIYNSQSSQYIILTLIRNKMPFIAFSSQYVKAGALAALECDYSDIGRQSAEIAIMVLQGHASGAVALSFPAKVRMVVNKRIAELLGVNIPATILNEATVVE